jgi:hypothetical protein
MRTSLLRLALLEGLPAVSALGLLGVVFGFPDLAYLALVPLSAWLVAAYVSALVATREAREDGTGAASAAARGFVAPVVATARAYFRLGLWRGRAFYDLACGGAFLMGLTWWGLLAAHDPSRRTVRWLALVPLLCVAFGIWRRIRERRQAPAMLTDVFTALDSWQHKRRRTDELSYERAVEDHLDRLGFDVAQGVKLPDGREADIIVRPKGRAGSWDWRDVMIEMKAHLSSTTERDRAMGQVETYAATWPGSIILMVCGDHRPDLLAPLDAKVSGFRAQGRPVTMIVKGRATQ